MSFRRGALFPTVFVLAACGRPPASVAANPPAFPENGDANALAAFVVGGWTESLDTSSARSTRTGDVAKFFEQGLEESLELRPDGTVVAGMAIGPRRNAKTGRWRVEGDQIVLDFPRVTDPDAQPSRWDEAGRQTKQFEDMVARYGPLKLSSDRRHLENAQVVRREDGSTFMGVPTWSRLSGK